MYKKYELLAIHEALCFVSKNRKDFLKMLNRNRPYKKRKIIESMGFSESGSRLVGKTFNYMHPNL